MQTLPRLAADSHAGGDENPVLPEPPKELTGQEALHEVMRFHLGGPVSGAGNAWLDMDILPALLHPYRDPDRIRTDYPLLLVPEEEPVALPRMMEQLDPGEGCRILHDNLPRLERHLRELAAGLTETVPARELLVRAGAAMRGALDLGDADDEKLASDLQELVEAVPPQAVLVPLTERTAFELFLRAARERGTLAGKSFRETLGIALDRARALLETDRLKRPESREAGSVQGSVGNVGSAFVDPGLLGKMMGAGLGGTALDAERRERIESAVRDMERGLPAEGSLPTLVHDGSFLRDAEIEGWTVQVSEDPCLAAAGCFDEAAGDLVRLFRAERVARLEADDAYRHDRHGPWLERLDWRSFSVEELRLLPPVVAVVDADHLARRGLASLSRLLLSGRPVQVMVLDHPGADPGSGDDITASRFEPGYLAMSHRDSWVQQTATVRPAHMMRGFRRALAAGRPGVHVIAAGAGRDGNHPRLGPWFYTGAALEGRAHPFFHYDPRAGQSWARRLDFSENPAPREDWPVYPLAVTRENGQAETITIPFTFADFALLETRYAAHFCPLPEGFPADDLVTLDLYLDLPPERVAESIPYVWGVDGRGKLLRLAITRQLALAAGDRLDYWHTLQELAGARSEYVEEAVALTRKEMEAAFDEERETLRAGHAEEMETVRRTAAEAVVTQLTAALLDVDPAELGGIEGAEALGVLAGLSRTPSAPPAPPARTAEAPAPSEAAEVAEAAPAPEVEEPEAEEALEPYIDTELCTSCNDCMQINRQLFVYNEDKKAYISDPSLGSFKDLVLAAEKCPARVIHPGTPLDPNEPDLDKWIERARPFN